MPILPGSKKPYIGLWALPLLLKLCTIFTWRGNRNGYKFMDAIVCPGCNIRVTPIRTFERAKQSAQWWRITKCPRERCGFNIDLEKCDNPGRGPQTNDNERSFWRDEL